MRGFIKKIRGRAVTLPLIYIITAFNLCIALQCKERGKNGGDHGHQLDEDVEARTRRIFEGVSYRVSNYRRRVRRRAFASEVTRFYVFFRVVPRSSGVGHEDRHHYSRHYRSAKHSSKRRRSKEVTYKHRRKDRHDSRHDHFS